LPTTGGVSFGIDFAVRKQPFGLPEIKLKRIFKLSEKDI